MRNTIKNEGKYLGDGSSNRARCIMKIGNLRLQVYPTYRGLAVCANELAETNSSIRDQQTCFRPCLDLPVSPSFTESHSIERDGDACMRRVCTRSRYECWPRYLGHRKAVEL